MLRSLVGSGLAVVTGHETGRPGPNAEIYAPNPDAAHVAGISVGPSGVAVEVSDLTGQTRQQFTVDVIERALSSLSVQHIQLAVPGSYDPASGEIRHIDLPGWSGPGVADRLRALAGCPLDVDNDVNLAAVAEREYQNGPFTLLWLDAGLGLAIDLGGELLRGASGGAGEIGYLPVGTGALQDMLGGTATDGLPIVEVARRVATALVAIVAVLDPPRIVLAGRLARRGGEELRRAVEAELSGRPFAVPVALSHVDGDPVLRGAVSAALTAVRHRLIQGESPALGGHGTNANKADPDARGGNTGPGPGGSLAGGWEYEQRVTRGENA
ncbi:ROK family protein [Longispora albida]|uniref:ROK family protein n=1 Tax=Longispora albida TaxID=203523 RepID=UPI000360794F|nr:ROK family protein [Longispora albida]